MNWTRYFFHDFFTAAEFNRMEDRLRQQRRHDSRSRSDLRLRVDELEDEVARLSLIAHALAEACVQSGALTREQMREATHRLDAADGMLDGQLGSPAQDDWQSSSDFLSDLEKKDRENDAS